MPPASAGDQLVRGLLVIVRGPLVLVTGVLQQLAPRRHVGAAAEQRPALALSHAAPDAELDAVVQRIGQALGADSAAAADQLGPILRRTLDKELVRVSPLACGAGGPVCDPHVGPLLL